LSRSLELLGPSILTGIIVDTHHPQRGAPAQKIVMLERVARKRIGEYRGSIRRGTAARADIDEPT
jgi:hypothetical protein